MANNVLDQVVTEQYAIYNGDSCELIQTVPDESVGICIHSPPFASDGGGALYRYTSSERDLSNCRSYEEFFLHYEFIVTQIKRVLMKGRLCGVHCMDVPRDGANTGGGLIDFPGDIIKLYEANGLQYCARYCVWKEPLAVRNRTMAKGLAHRQIVEDSSLCDVASADYLLMFRKKGTNPEPIQHPTGLATYAGSREIPTNLLRYRGWKGKQTENRLSHWIWRQYASAFWDDVRVTHVLPYKEARDKDDERHMHPLQLDVIERCLTLWSNPGEVVLTPFMGVGSEVYKAVQMGRNGWGCELKSSYFRQAVRNLSEIKPLTAEENLFSKIADDMNDDELMD